MACPHLTIFSAAMEFPTCPAKKALIQNFIEFMSARGKGKGRILSTEDMQKLVGKPRLDLHEHDLYVMGRTPDNKALWSIIRIKCNTTAENKIQGKLGVRFLHGYGKLKAGSDSLKVTFAEGIRRYTTEDSVGFKHRSAFYLGGRFYRLTHVEHLCNIAVMSAAEQVKFQSTTSIKKAQSYSMQRAKKREWAHMSRERCQEDQKNKILKMMIPYWNNSPDFYSVFVQDITSACQSAKLSLGPPEPCESSLGVKLSHEPTEPCVDNRSNEAVRKKDELVAVRPKRGRGLVVW